MARPLWEKNSWHWSDQSQIYRNPQKSKWQWCCLNLSSHFPQSHIHVAFCFVMGAIGKSHDGAAVRCPESSATPPPKHTQSSPESSRAPLLSHLRKDVPGDDTGPQKPLPPPISCGAHSRLSPFPNPEINFKSPLIAFVPLPSTPQRTKTADLSCRICSWGSEYIKISPKPKCLKK